MAREIRRVPGLWTAVSPIFHFGTDDTGIGPTTRRSKLWDSGTQSHEDIPIINANAIRGILRRLIGEDFLEQVGYENVSPKLHHALMSGGQLESTDDTTATCDMALRRQLIDNIPPLGLLGTSVGNQILSSVLRVKHAYPLCAERKWERDLRRKGTGLMPPVYRPWDEDEQWEKSGNEMTSRHFYTRRDDLHVDREKDDQAVQMLVNPECIIEGTKFEHEFVLEEATEVEVACLGWALRLWAEEPTIGGKASGGMGQLIIDYDNVPEPDPYLAWCTEHVEEAVEALNLIANPPKKAKKQKEVAAE